MFVKLTRRFRGSHIAPKVLVAIDQIISVSPKLANTRREGLTLSPDGGSLVQMMSATQFGSMSIWVTESVEEVDRLISETNHAYKICQEVLRGKL